jgi:HEAT repeat protein
VNHRIFTSPVCYRPLRTKWFFVYSGPRFPERNIDGKRNGTLPEVSFVGAEEHDPVKEALKRREERLEQNIGILIRQLGDENPTFRTRSAESLGNTGDPRAVEPLIRLLSDPVPDVVWVTLRALGRLRDPRAIDAIVDSLDSPDRWTRQGAVWALGEIGDRRTAVVIIPLCSDEKKGVRSVSAEALGKLGDPRSAGTLRKLLNDDEMEVRQAAREALAKLPKENYPTDWGFEKPEKRDR